MSRINNNTQNQTNNSNFKNEQEMISDNYFFIKYDNGVKINIPKKEYEKHLKILKDIKDSHRKDVSKKVKKMKKEDLAKSIDRLFQNKKKIYCGALPSLDEGQCFCSTSELIFTNSVIKECEDRFMSVCKPYAQSMDIHDYVMDPQTMYITKLLEDILILIKLVISAKNKSDYVFAIYVFSKLRLGDNPLIQSLFMDDMAKYLFKLLEEHLEPIFQAGDEDYVESTFANLHDLLNKYSAIKKSPFVKKLYKFSMYALSLSIFSKIGITFSSLNYSKIEEEAIKNKYHLGADFVYCLCDTVLFICERGYQCMKTGELSPLFHSPKTYENFFNNSQELIRRSKCMHNPELFGDNEFKFRADLDSAIEKGLSIVKYGIEMQPFEKEIMRRVVNDLRMIQCDMMTKSAAKEMREPPFSILLSGDSSIGKSSLMDMIFTHFGKKQKLPIGSEYKYTRNAAANFWDGFTTSQWCIVFDDVAFMNPNKAPQGDPSLMEVIQLINAVPFTPDQAALEDKGRTPVKAKLVIASTNTEDLNAHHYFSYASAVQRRFPYIIEPIVKSEYVSENGRMLDSSKCPINTSYPDLWNFTIKKVRPTPIGEGKSKKAIITTIHEHIDLKQFLLWLNDAINEHDRNQKSVTNSLNVMKQVNLCDSCCLPNNLCECVRELQSGENDPYFNFYFFKFHYTRLNDWFVYFDLIWLKANFTAMYLISGSYLIALLWTLSVKMCTYTADKFSTYLMDKVLGVPSFAYFLSETRIGQICLSMMLYRFNIQPTDTLMRIIFKKAGALFQRTYGNPIFLAKITLYLTTLTTLYALRNKLFSFILSAKHEGATSSKDIGTAPPSVDGDRENVWYKNDYELSVFDYTPEQIGSRGLTIEQFGKMIEKNVVEIVMSCESEQTAKITGAICLRDNLYMLNAHAIPNDKVIQLAVINESLKDGVNSNAAQVVYKNNFIFMDKDVAVIELRGMCPKKDITKYFACDSFYGVWNGLMVGRNRDGQIFKNNLRRISLKDATWLPSVTGKHWEYTPQIPTKAGDCGSLIIAETPKGFVLLGMHYAGIQTAYLQIAVPLSAAIPITQPLIEKLNILFPRKCNPTAPSLKSDSKEIILGDLHKKSPFRFVEQGSCQVYGSFVGFRCQPKSTVCESILTPILKDHGYSIKYTKPSMKGWAAKRKTLLDIMSMQHNFDSDILDHIVEQFGNNIVSKLGDKIKDIMVYDDFTAVNGAAGVTYVDKMNRNTSAGFPWRCSKKYYIHAIEPVGQNLNPVEASPEIMKRVDIIINKYLNGDMYHPVFTASFKDEPVSFAKAQEHATRVFMGAPFDWSIVVRKYCLSFIKVIQSNRFVFECGAGTIAQSDEWHYYREWLCHFGEDRIIAGDYSKFDKRMGSEIILAAFNLMIHVMKASDMSEEDIKVVQGIAYDTAFPMVDYFGDLVQFNGCNPSGHPLTVIINSLANSIYMRYCYYLLNPDHEIESFQEKIHLMTYGDDNIMGVSPSAPWFTHTTIANILATYGIKYTMAEKDQASIPYIHINDASFLKRKWVYCKDMERYLCVLDEESIHKSLTVWVPSKTICSEQQAIAIMNSAVMEYFFHGKEKFEQMRSFFLSVIFEYGRHTHLNLYYEGNEFPTWIQLALRYHESSKRIQRPELTGLYQTQALECSLLLDLLKSVDNID